MPTPQLKITLPGISEETGMTANLFALSGAQNAAAIRTGIALTGDTVSTTTYWGSTSGTGLSGYYRLDAYYSDGGDAGSCYFLLTDTNSVHVGMPTPNFTEIDGTGSEGGESSDVLIDTTIATLATQTSFTLTAGSADNDAYNGCFAIITDQSTAVQKAVVPITDYVGSTRTVTLGEAPKFTVATGDSIAVFGINLTGTSVGLTAAAVTALVAAIWAAATSALTTVGSIGKLIVDSLAALGGGSGARSVTITVNDGATVLEDAIVRLSQGAESYVGDTNASGVVTFNVNDATWTVAITKPGYSFAGTTLVVNGTETVTYSMSSISFSVPADPEFCTLAIRVWGKGTGAVAAGVVVKAKIYAAPDGDGELFNDDTMTATTGADGYAEFTVPKGCSVTYWVGASEKSLDAIEEDTVEFVNNWLGHE